MHNSMNCLRDYENVVVGVVAFIAIQIQEYKLYSHGFPNVCVFKRHSINVLGF